MTRLSGVIAKAVVVIVNFINALLQDRHDVVERAQTIRIILAAGIGAVDGDNSVIPVVTR